MHVSTHLFILYICGNCFSLGALSGGGVLWLVKPVTKGFPFFWWQAQFVAGLNHTNTYKLNSGFYLNWQAWSPNYTKLVSVSLTGQPKIKVQKCFLEKQIVVTLRAQGAGWDWVGLRGSWESKVLSPALGDTDRVWPSKSSWRRTHTAPWWSFCHPAKIFKGSLTLAKPLFFLPSP